MQIITKNKLGEWELADYLDYIENIKDALPTHAHDFALLEGHYDLHHNRCPHDSWLEFINLKETPHEERRTFRTLQIHARFLNSYHDGFFEITYTNVQNYSLKLDRVFRTPHPISNVKGPPIGHGDWLVDEILLLENGAVSHEIEFSDSGEWKIICEDIKYEWIGWQ